MASLSRDREPVKGSKVETFISSIRTHCLSGEGVWSFLSCLLCESSILLNDSFQILSKPSLQITLAERAPIPPLWHIVTEKCTMLSGQSSSIWICDSIQAQNGNWVWWWGPASVLPPYIYIFCRLQREVSIHVENTGILQNSHLCQNISGQHPESWLLSLSSLPHTIRSRP